MISGGMRRYQEGNTDGEAGLWARTDAEKRKHGERTGLDTLVVHAVNVGH